MLQIDMIWHKEKLLIKVCIYFNAVNRITKVLYIVICSMIVKLGLFEVALWSLSPAASEGFIHMKFSN